MVTEPIPNPGKGQVLIKVAYSTINPYDRICYRNEQQEGFTLGCDGCGIVTEVGEGVSEDKKGKKVAFLGGAWANYAVKDDEFVVYLDDDMDLTTCANTYVNPFTALAMLDFARKDGAPAVISLAASSALNKQFIRLCQQEGMEVINVVRGEDKVKDL